MKSFILLAFTLILSGCGIKTEDSDNSIRMKEGEKLSTYTHNLSIDFSTPEGVGALLALNEGLYSQRNVGICTWFLIDSKRAMTNSHCIPDALKKNKSLNCGDYLQGMFRTSHGNVKARCKKLLHYSDISKATVLNNDYALIELTKAIDSKPFKLDRKGILENEKVIILSMNHRQSSSGIYSEFKEHRCLMKSSDVLGKISSAGSSPLTGFKEENSADTCKTIQGNSGSPVIDESGNLVGILHGGMKEGADLNQGLRITSSKITSDVSILTNLRCQKFNDSVLDADYPATCAEESKVSKLDTDKILKELQPKIQKKIEIASSKQPTYFEYNTEIKSNGTDDQVNFSIKCIKPLNEWNEQDLSLIKKDGLLTNKKSIRSKVNQHKLTYTISLNYYGNVQMEPDISDFGNLEFNITGLQDLDKKGYVTSALDLSAIGVTSSYESKINLCAKAAAKK